MTEKTVLQTLVSARAVIASAENWTIKSQGKLANGWDTNANDPDAVRFCALGAIGRTLGERYAHDDSVGVEELAAAAPETIKNQVRKEYCGPLCLGAVVAKFNNSSTHPEVLALFDRAIESERAKSRQVVIDQILDDAAHSAPAPIRKTLATEADRALTQGDCA